MNVQVMTPSMPLPVANSKRTTSQSNRDHEMVKSRSSSLGPKLDLVSGQLKRMYGANVTAVSLLHRANNLERILGITVDRLARRNRQALFCWFTENWELIQPILTQNSRKAIHIQPIIEFTDVSDLSRLLNYH